MMKKYGCQCNYRPARVEVHKPNYSPEYDMDYRKPYPESKHEMETIVKCGMGMSPGPLCRNTGILVGVANSIPGGGYKHENPVIACVVLDTRNIKDPTVKIDFSSLISFKTYGCGGYFLRLAFKLSKVCDGGNPVPLGIWTFEKAEENQYPMVDSVTPEEAVNNNSSVQETDSFCFTWCQCEGCPGCCTYIVELVDQDCYNIEFATISNIFITGIANGFKKY
ncbi:MAG: DUF4489 domain-containing protein [Syntrophomonas sp.]